jgi:hypothetical protein
LPTHGLLDPYLKLGRAELHLKSLDAELKLFAKTDPYTITREDDLKTQLHIIKTKLADVPDHIPMIVGEAVYCMRCSLDQLVWSMARRLGGTLHPDQTQFPIIGVNNSIGRKQFARQTEGVPDAAIDEIRSFQPYHRGATYKAHPLWRLNTLSNTDKHRRIPANGSEATMRFPAELREFMTLETLDDYGITSIPLAMKHKVALNPRVAFKVNFGWGLDSEPESFIEDREGLWEIYNFIKDVVIPRFVRFFA